MMVPPIPKPHLLQQQASSGRSDALEALRIARGRGGQATTISASKTAAVPPLEAQAQVTKQGTVIQKVGEHEIRHTSKGLNVEPNVGDDVLLELIGRAAEWYEGGLTAYGQLIFNSGSPALPARIIWRFHSRILNSKKRGLLPRQQPQRRSIRQRLSTLLNGI